MIDEILILEEGFDENVEKDSEENKVKSVCVEVQIESFEFFFDMKGDSILIIGIKYKEYVRKKCGFYRVFMYDIYKELEIMVQNGIKLFNEF